MKTWRRAGTAVLAAIVNFSFSAPGGLAETVQPPKVTLYWSFDGTATVQTPAPKISLPENHDDAMVPKPTVTASPSVTFDKDGMTLTYAATATSAFYSFRTKDGVPFLDKSAQDREARVGFVLTYTLGNDVHTVFAYANRDHHCYVDGPTVPVDERDLCASAAPKPSPSPSSSPTASPNPSPSASAAFLVTPSPSPTITPAAKKDDPTKLEGTLTIKYALLRQLLRPTVTWPSHGGTATQPARNETRVTLCEAIGDTEDYVQHTCAPNESADPATAQGTSVVIEHLDGSNQKNQRQVGYSFGSPGGNNGKGDSSGTSDQSGSSTQSLFRITQNTHSSGNSPAPKASPQPANRGNVSASLIYPFTFELRGSGVAQNVDLSFLGKQTKDLLQRYGRTALTSLGLSSASTPEFSKVDTDFFSVAHSPTLPNLALKAGQFDLNMQPIDFSKIGQINYGGKLAWTPLDADLAATWFKNVDLQNSGAAFHADVRIPPNTALLGRLVAQGSNGELSLTNAVANYPGKSDNVYITASHTANTVAGLVLPGKEEQTFLRYGGLGAAHDFVVSESYEPVNNQRYTLDGATALGPRALIGYRSIDDAYRPLATTFDPLTGTKSAFGLLGYTFGSETSSHVPAVDLSIGGTRSFDAYQTRYRDVVGKIAITLGKHTLSGSIDTSALADSVVARVGGSVLIDPASRLGQTMLPNNSQELSDTLSFTDGALKGWSLKGGVRLYNDPSCTNRPPGGAAKPKLPTEKVAQITSPSCVSPLRRNISESLHFQNEDYFEAHLDVGSPKTVASGGPSGATTNVPSAGTSPATPTNQLSAQAVLTGVLWRCVSASASYGNNASLDTRSFVPGALTEASIDVDPFPHWALTTLLTPVIRFSYQNVVASTGVPSTTSQHNVYVSFVADDRAKKLAAHCSATKSK
ncbi:MAG: hypothetical protein JO043_05075 [Candidatus Eremiobacteraeota bacterium]|nr:hypothetical protein [Candidatus Eremiobacteraeota bacterium]